MASSRLAVAALATVLLGLPSCAIDGGVRSKASPAGAFKWGLGADGNYHYLGVSTKADNAYGYVLAKRDLYPPFRWEVTVGLGEWTPEDIGWFATELDATGTNPLQFWLLGAEPEGNGFQVFAANYIHTSRQGQTYFSGVDAVDLAIEHNGTTVYFAARAHGDLDWTLIWSTPAGGAVMPVHPAIGVMGLDREAVAGFKRFRVVNSTPPAMAPVAWYGTILDLYAAVDHFVTAMDLSDGDQPEPFDAATAVNDGLADLDDAIAGIGTLIPAAKEPPGAPEALKAAQKARKAAASVAKKLEGAKAGKTAIKGLLKAIGPALEAADILRNM